jgi:hypothetical protein
MMWLFCRVMHEEAQAFEGLNSAMLFREAPDAKAARLAATEAQQPLPAVTSVSAAPL